VNAVQEFPKNPVIVVWTRSLDAWVEGYCQVLSYADGSPRIYEKGKSDSRLADTRYAATRRKLDAIFAVVAGPANPVEIPLSLAKRLNLL